MSKPQQAPLPQELLIGPNWRIEFDAISPTTGAPVAGVVVTAANVTATNAASGKQEVLTPGPFMLVPGPQGGTGDLIGGGTPSPVKGGGGGIGGPAA